MNSTPLICIRQSAYSVKYSPISVHRRRPRVRTCTTLSTLSRFSKTPGDMAAGDAP